jgi:hypothetical protein
MALSKQAKERLIVALADQKTGEEVARAIDVVSSGSVAGPPNAFAAFDGTGILADITGWSVNSYKGFNIGVTLAPNDLGGGQGWHFFSSFLNPLQDSPNESWNLFSKSAFIDTLSSGFDFGTNATAVQIENYFFSHQGTSDVGGLVFQNMNTAFGNGTDPIQIGGLSYVQGYANFANAVTVGPVQGYIFNPSWQAGSATSSSHYQNAFADFTFMSGVDSGQYISFTAVPTIGGIKNNSNYSGVNVAPSITAFNGNAGFTGIGVTPNLGTFDTGFFNGININPTVSSVVNAVGLSVDMSNVTASGLKRAADFNGDVFINGSLSFTGGLSIGQLAAFYSQNAVASGPSGPTTLHGLISEMVAVDSSTVSNVDMLGVNTASLIRLEENSTTTAGALQIGLTALALPCVVLTETGSNLDYMNATVSAINLDAASTGGTIQNAHLYRATIIPNGVTTIDKTKAFFYDAPFGPVGTERWGVYIDVDSENFFKTSIKIGGTDKVSNSSVALEIDSTSKAFLNARMTAAQRDALTAIDGMQIYNTDTNRLQVRENGVWVNVT